MGRLQDTWSVQQTFLADLDKGDAGLLYSRTSIQSQMGNGTVGVATRAEEEVAHHARMMRPEDIICKQLSLFARTYSEQGFTIWARRRNE